MCPKKVDLVGHMKSLMNCNVTNYRETLLLYYVPQICYLFIFIQLEFTPPKAKLLLDGMETSKLK